MRKITLSNENFRDATVCYNNPRSTNQENCFHGRTVRYVKQTFKTQENNILKKYGNDKIKLAKSLINEDPEIDFNIVGKIVESAHKVFLTQDNIPAYNAKVLEVICDSDGNEVERRDKKEIHTTINDVDFPLRWTGLLIPQKEAVKKYVISHIYQLHHVNGLTFDFLFEMARKLGDSESVMYIAGGQTGQDPIVMQEGGKPYRGFLYGWTEKTKYVLLLLLSELEICDLKIADNE